MWRGVFSDAVDDDTERRIYAVQVRQRIIDRPGSADSHGRAVYCRGE
jgi:hypothetical protein